MQILNTRNDEPVMLLLQDNAAKRVRLIAADETLLKIVGLNPDAENINFLSLLGSEHKKHIKDDLQYHANQKDLLEIMQHMRNLKFAAAGESFAFHVVREVPQNGCDVFRIILLQTKHQQKYDLIEALQQNMAGHAVLDAATGLPDAPSMQQFIELAQNYTNIETAFVHVEVAPQTAEMQRIIALAVRRSLRQVDVVGLLTGGAVGFLLNNVNIEVAHLAINRLRTALACDPFLSQKRISYHLRFGGTLIHSHKNSFEIITLVRDILAADITKDVVMAH